ncbi:tetratricopeptide repeat protein [Streptomyces sp. NBC_01408]|uniref:tetratricopeptide repeat protein n=1 Tax=Streptomyces sp. NBC_01408 TaxID=2903855 RepID=UPI0022576661|nr:tetratricopeptide repeat protein [Streptomyces sp. NBC_01408]MCX4691761.1 tetratricopeptide repeat protein [Streptomyces sp. NBC_01408]
MGVEQWAKASGESQITQIAGDQYVYEPGAGPAPQALLGLPEAPAVLVGRDGPVRELLALLADGGSPVAVVAGLAGVGKSALAVATAHRAVELGWFADRVFFLSLRGYAPDGGVSGPQAVQELLGHLGIRDTDLPPSPQGQLALYRARLAAYAQAGQRVLVVADDAGSVAQVRDLVPAGDTHRLLVTSRHRLVAPGFAARLIALDELEEGPSAQLLAGALLRTWPDDPRTAREPEALAAVAEACGRLPLALTVAGALLAGDPGLPAAALAGQLADARTRLEALTFDEGDGGVPVGVRAAFGLSYERLPADQARIFRLLTVNPGPDCSTHYAQLITGQAVGLRSRLAGLVRASLLTEQPLGSGRWRMHDLVRLYAQERGEECAQQDGRDAAVDALLTSLIADAGRTQQALGMSGRAPGGPGLPSTAEALRWLDAERPLLVAAVDLAAAEGRPDTATRLGQLVRPYLLLYGHVEEAVAVARRLLDVARRTGTREDVGVGLYDLALVLVNVFAREEATDKATEALAVFREVPLRMGEGKALNLLGGLHRDGHRFEEALQAYEGAREILSELGITHALGATLTGLGKVYEKLGRTEEAVAAYRKAVEFLRDTNDPHREAEARAFLADALWEAGRRQEALAVREEVLARVRRLGNRKREGWALNGLASLLRSDGRTQEARARYEEALAVFVAEGDRHGEGGTLHNLAQIDQEAGRLEEALAAQERACALMAGVAGPAHEALVAAGLGNLLALLHRPAEAAEAWERAAGLYASTGDEGQATRARAEAARLRG